VVGLRDGHVVLDGPPRQDVDLFYQPASVKAV
jgi:hypothetical protein